jgi:YVTN family beta-propeller protein
LATAAAAAVGAGGLRARRGLIAALAAVLALVAAALVAVFVVSGGGAASVEVVPNSVALIDPASNRVTDLVRIPAESPGPIDFAGGKLWVMNRASFSVTVIDAKTRAVLNTFGLGAQEGYPNGMAADKGGVWATGSTSSRVTWYGENVNEGVTVTNGQASLGTGSELAREGQDLWVTGVIQPFIAQVDINGFSPEVVYRRSLEEAPTALAAGQGLGYVGDAQGGLIRIDPVTREERAVPLKGRIQDLAVSGDFLWVVTDESKLLRLALGSLTTTATVKLPDLPSALAVGAGSVWVVSAHVGTVTRVDLRTNQVVKTITIGHRPQGIEVADGLVWVTVRR